MEEEVWKDIQGYEGMYQISNKGNVKSLNYNHTKKEKLLRLHLSKHGYYYVSLNKDSKGKKFKIHRLIALSFIPNPENKPCINHINEIKTDNDISNLEWVTLAENTSYSLGIDIKILHKGEILTFPSILSAADHLGIDYDSALTRSKRFIELLRTVNSLLDNDYSKMVKFDKKVQKSNTVGYTGISIKGDKYYSRVGYNKKRVFTGSFDTIEEAVESRDDFIIKNSINLPLQGIRSEKKISNKSFNDLWLLLKNEIEGITEEIDLIIKNIDSVL